MQAMALTRLASAEDVCSPMHIAWERAEQGMFHEGHGWVVNPRKDGFAKAPIEEGLKRDYMLMELWRQPPHRDDWDRWLDSMTYLDFLTDVMKLSPKVAEHLNPQTAAMGCGLGADAISAYSACEFIQPGGNTGIFRHFVKHLVPESIEGGFELKDVLEGRIDFPALDRPLRPLRAHRRAALADGGGRGPAGGAPGPGVTGQGQPGDAASTAIASTGMGARPGSMPDDVDAVRWLGHGENRGCSTGGDRPCLAA